MLRVLPSAGIGFYNGDLVLYHSTHEGLDVLKQVVKAGTRKEFFWSEPEYDYTAKSWHVSASVPEDDMCTVMQFFEIFDTCLDIYRKKKACAMYN